MNFHPQEASLSRSQGETASTLQIDDLNSLIDSLKRREENIIQLLDYNLKFKGSSNHMDVVHLRGLYIQLNEREKKRIEQEDSIIQKYVDMYIHDEYQKKLITKMRNKIVQLNSSAKDKLVQLGIFQHSKQVYIGIATFEENLGRILNQLPVNVYLFFNCLVENSRKRFINEIDPDACQSSNSIQQKDSEIGPNSMRLGASSKGSSQKSTPPISSKPNEETKWRDNIKTKEGKNIVPLSQEMSLVGRTSLQIKSEDSRPSLDLREDIKASYDMLGLQKGSYTNHASEITRLQAYSQNETINEQTLGIKDTPSYRELNSKQEGLALSINLNQSAFANDRALSMVPNNSSRVSTVKKVKIPPNKKSMCLDETNDTQQDKKEIDKKEQRPNTEAWLKNYDILKIEYQPLPTATKKETKKLLMEKVLKELLIANNDIKKTIKRYRANVMINASKKQEEETVEINKNETGGQEIETNGSKYLNSKIQSSLPSFKSKVPTLNSTQRSIFYAKNTREMKNIEGSDNYLNVFNPFCSSSVNNITKQSQEVLPKKQVSTMFLVLPKLNLHPETHTPSSFPSWPTPSQDPKAIKSPFTMDLVDKSKFEKLQKGLDKPLSQLVTENKQEQKILSPVVNQSIGAKFFSNSFNKTIYPLQLPH